MNKAWVNSMYRRRMSTPEVVQQLWDAVKVIRYQRQVPSADRIIKFMSRIYAVNEEEVTRQLGHCVRDELLHVFKKKGSKGAKSGVEQEGYKLPEGSAERDQHDWYCAKCHKVGDVIQCSECHRVYHVFCITDPKSNKHKFQCSTCLAIEEDTDLQDIKPKVLNRLLYMVCTLLKDRYRAFLRSSNSLCRPVNIGPPGAQIDIATNGEAWRIPFFIHKLSDIGEMASKARRSVYTNLSQFEADCLTIVHNIVIFHGQHSNLADLARTMARDCHAELKQIRWCYTCYLATGGGKNSQRREFYKPCRPPHELVYAKENSRSPYWPAKVIREENDTLDVQFFGGTHFRTTVDRSDTVPISTNVTSLQEFKRTGSWNRACDEMDKLRKLLKDIDDGAYQSSSSSFDSDDSLKSEKSSKSSLPHTPLSTPSVSAILAPTPSASVPRVAKPGRRLGRPPGSGKKKLTPARRPRKNSSSDGNVSSDDNDSDVSYAERVKKKKEPAPEVAAVPVPAEDAAMSTEEATVTPPVVKKRGRPRISPKVPATTEPSPPKKKRGRPRKIKEETPVVPKDEIDEVAGDDEDEDAEGPSTAQISPRASTRIQPKRKSSEGPSAANGSVSGLQLPELRKSVVPPPEPTSDEDDEIKPEADKDDDVGDNSNSTRDDSVERPSAVPSQLSSTLSPSRSHPFKNEEEIVSSSCQEPQTLSGCSVGTQTKSDLRKEKANKELIAKLTLELEELKSARIEEMRQLREAHAQEITATKKKQWCYNCELEAIYHCCWNTAYCSTGCQQLHWQREHKRVCRRKR